MTPPTGAAEEVAPHVDAVKAAVVQTLDDGCGIQLRPWDEPEVDSGKVVVGIVSVGGDVGWTAFLALEERSAVAAAKSFVGMEVPFDEPDMCEAIREVANLFSVRVKNALEKCGIAVKVSMPNVVRMASMGDFVALANPNEVMCFRSRSGRVWAGVFAVSQQ